MSNNEIIELVRLKGSYETFKSDKSLYRKAKRKRLLKVCGALYGLTIEDAATDYPDELIVETAKRYSDRKAWKKAHDNHYRIAWARGLLPQIYDVISKAPRVVEKKYTKEHIIEVAKTCKDHADFCNQHRKLYHYAWVNGWSSDLKALLPPGAHNQPAYEESELAEDAKKYTSRDEWEKAGKALISEGKASHFNVAKSKGREFMQRVCAHMPRVIVERKNKYTDEEIIASAQKYQHKNDWKRGPDRNMYNAAMPRRPEVFARATAHMTPQANPYIGAYIIYVYEFAESRHAYVGLTCKPTLRTAQHTKGGTVFDYRQANSGLTCEYKVLESAIPSPDAAAKQEAHWHQTYVDQGWTMLNQAKTGSLGAVYFKWDYDTIIEDAQLYKTRTAWLKASRVAYEKASFIGCFAEAVAHMPERVKGAGLGVPKSDEARAKMSLAAQKRAADPAWRAQHSETMKGRKPSAATTQAAKEALMGKPHANRLAWEARSAAILEENRRKVMPFVKEGMNRMEIAKEVFKYGITTSLKKAYYLLNRAGIKGTPKIPAVALTSAPSRATLVVS